MAERSNPEHLEALEARAKSVILTRRFLAVMAHCLGCRPPPAPTVGCQGITHVVLTVIRKEPLPPPLLADSVIRAALKPPITCHATPLRIYGGSSPNRWAPAMHSGARSWSYQHAHDPAHAVGERRPSRMASLGDYHRPCLRPRANGYSAGRPLAGGCGLACPFCLPFFGYSLACPGPSPQAPLGFSRRLYCLARRCQRRADLTARAENGRRAGPDGSWAKKWQASSPHAMLGIHSGCQAMSRNVKLCLSRSIEIFA
jgi:hypothetical protein